MFITQRFKYTEGGVVKTDNVHLEIREISSGSAPVVLEGTFGLVGVDSGVITYRSFESKLFTDRVPHRRVEFGTLYPLPKNQPFGPDVNKTATRAERITAFESWALDRILIDGQLWRAVGEPIYQITNDQISVVHTTDYSDLTGIFYRADEESAARARAQQLFGREITPQATFEVISGDAGSFLQFNSNRFIEREYRVTLITPESRAGGDMNFDEFVLAFDSVNHATERVFRQVSERFVSPRDAGELITATGGDPGALGLSLSGGEVSDLSRIANLQCLYMGDDLAQFGDGGTIGFWRNSHDPSRSMFYAAGIPMAKRDGINGGWSLDFNGSSLLQQTLGAPPNTATTVFITFQPNNDTDYCLFQINNSGTERWRKSSNGHGSLRSYGGAVITDYPTDMPDSGVHLVTIVAGATLELFLDGVGKGPQAYTRGTSFFLFGSAAGSQGFYNGLVKDMVIVSRAVETAERQSIEARLAARAGITL